MSGIGIDAEPLVRFARLQTTRAGASLLRAACTGAEQAAIGSDARLLTLAWTTKEAAAKALGCGLRGTDAGAACREIDVTAILAPDGTRAARVTLTGRTHALAASADVHAVVASGRVLGTCAVSFAFAVRSAGGADAALQLLTGEAMWDAAARRPRRQDRA